MNYIKNIEETSEFKNWLSGLRDRDARLRILSRISKIAQTGHLGDAKPLGKGLSELRFDFGPGYRVYFALRRDVVIVLIGGGDKSTQDRDIRVARRYLEID
jgi:putative addiction module killer protein